jgi:glycosyltransferase involved in cell wall biosynthesis
LKKLLIISPHFPPLNAPDMQRIRMSLPFYRANGWEPVVLTIADEYQEGVREPELLATLPPDVRIIRIPAIPVRAARWCGLGNTGLRMLPYLLWHGSRLLRAEKFDVVFFSNTQFVTFPLGRLWRRWFGVPYVIDIQDPWRTDYYERRDSRSPPGGWKYQFARFQAWLLEGWTYQRVGAVMSVSPSYLTDLRARYPSFVNVPAEVIRFGGSREDMVHAAAHPLAQPLFNRTKGEIHLLYTGASGPVMPHSLSVLFDGFRRYRERHPERAARLRFHFVGTSYVAPGTGQPSVLPVAAECGVADNVEEIPHRIGHLEALRWQQQADVLLMPGSSDLAYSPSKLYPYFLSGRPILGLVFRHSVMEQLLDELTCAYMVRFVDAEPKEQAYAELAAFFDHVIAGFPAGSLPTRNEAHFNRNYLAQELTGHQCALFERLVSPASTGSPSAATAV